MDEAENNLSERDEADVIEHRYIDQHDQLVTIVSQQTIMAHNRSMDCSTAEAHSEAEIIATMTDLYLSLINS